MSDMRMNTRGSSTARRMAHSRERGMESVSLITRGAVAISLVLAAVLSAVAAIGFAGHSTASASAASSGTTSTRGSSGGQRVALPPTGAGALAPPIAPPISQPVQAPPPVTSGGS